MFKKPVIRKAVTHMSKSVYPHPWAAGKCDNVGGGLTTIYSLVFSFENWSKRCVTKQCLPLQLTPSRKVIMSWNICSSFAGLHNVHISVLTTCNQLVLQSCCTQTVWSVNVQNREHADESRVRCDLLCMDFISTWIDHQNYEHQELTVTHILSQIVS